MESHLPKDTLPSLVDFGPMKMKVWVFTKMTKTGQWTRVHSYYHWNQLSLILYQGCDYFTLLNKVLAKTLETHLPVRPCELSLGPLAAQYPSASTWRHRIGLVVERLCTGRGRHKNFFPFHIAASQRWWLKAWGDKHTDTNTNTLDASHNIQQTLVVLVAYYEERSENSASISIK